MFVELDCQRFVNYLTLVASEEEMCWSRSAQKRMTACLVPSQIGSCCLTAQQRDKQGGFYWENLLSGMALRTDIRISISISTLPNIPKWAWQRTKPASSPGAKVTGGWWCTCHYGANDLLPDPLQENKQKPHQDMKTIWTVLDICLIVTALNWGPCDVIGEIKQPVADKMQNGKLE